MNSLIQWISSIPQKIISFLIRSFKFFVSLFFVRLNISTAQNVTSGNDYKEIADKFIEKNRIKFLSRRFEVSWNRKVKFGTGFYTCKSEFFYFANVFYDQPLYVKHSDTWETVKVIKYIDFYVPFWNFKKLYKDIEKIQTKKFENNFSCTNKFNYSDDLDDYEELKNFDMNVYNQDDLNNLDIEFNYIMNNDIMKEKIISIDAKNMNNILENIAIKNDMNIFNVADYYMGWEHTSTTRERLEEFLKYNDEKPFILNILTDERYRIDIKDKRGVNRIDFKYKEFFHGRIIESVIGDIKYIIAVDVQNTNKVIDESKHYMKKYSHRANWEEFHGCKNISKFMLRSTKVKVRLKDE